MIEKFKSSIENTLYALADNAWLKYDIELATFIYSMLVICIMLAGSLLLYKILVRCLVLTHTILRELKLFNKVGKVIALMITTCFIIYCGASIIYAITFVSNLTFKPIDLDNPKKVIYKLQTVPYLKNDIKEIKRNIENNNNKETISQINKIYSQANISTPKKDLEKLNNLNNKAFEKTFKYYLAEDISANEKEEDAIIRPSNVTLQYNRALVQYAYKSGDLLKFIKAHIPEINSIELTKNGLQYQ